MKIINKTYVLVGILIAVALVNLAVLYGTQALVANESYSIIRSGDLKTKTETIAGLAISIANGKESDRPTLEKEINEFDSTLDTLKTGGAIRGQIVSPIPDQILSDYEDVKDDWNSYRSAVIEIKSTSLYNENVLDAINYVLEKDTELILTTDALVKDLETLDRDYNAHREIATNLRETAKEIGQNTLRVSLEQGDGAKQDLQNSRIAFDIGIRKLLLLPLDDLDVTGIDTAELALIPRENSKSLDEVDLLWEATRLRIKTIENESLYSDINNPITELTDQRQSLLGSIDQLLDMWNNDRIDRRNQNLLVTQAVIGIDVIIFVAVVITIRQSLNPLEKITHALSKVREGVYGEKINYTSKDEIGELASSFNTMTETIKQKEEDAKKIDIAKDEFLAMITHELKTPLVPIRGYADILLGGHLGDLTEKQRERISIIKSSASSLLQLISDLLDVQKLELGQLKIQKENMDIYDTITKSIQTLQPQIEQDQASITNEVEHLSVPHDSDRITQVLTNLIKNSLKAVQPGDGKIHIRSEQTPDEVKIMISDNGSGIPYDKQSNLFTKFYQADATMTREKGGSGLGLSICKGIIEVHGGKISMQSTPGSGTIVTFSLPKTEHRGAI